MSVRLCIDGNQWWYDFLRSHDPDLELIDSLSDDQWCDWLDAILAPWGAHDVRDSETDIEFESEALMTVFLLRWS